MRLKDSHRLWLPRAIVSQNSCQWTSPTYHMQPMGSLSPYFSWSPNIRMCKAVCHISSVKLFAWLCTEYLFPLPKNRTQQNRAYRGKVFHGSLHGPLQSNNGMTHYVMCACLDNSGRFHTRTLAQRDSSMNTCVHLSPSAETGAGPYRQTNVSWLNSLLGLYKYTQFCRELSKTGWPRSSTCCNDIPPTA